MRHNYNYNKSISADDAVDFIDKSDTVDTFFDLYQEEITSLIKGDEVYKDYNDSAIKKHFENNWQDIAETIINYDDGGVIECIVRTMVSPGECYEVTYMDDKDYYQIVFFTPTPETKEDCFFMAIQLKEAMEKFGITKAELDKEVLRSALTLRR